MNKNLTHHLLIFTAISSILGILIGYRSYVRGSWDTELFLPAILILFLLGLLHLLTLTQAFREKSSKILDFDWTKQYLQRNTHISAEQAFLRDCLKPYGDDLDWSKLVEAAIRKRYWDTKDEKDLARIGSAIKNDPDLTGAQMKKWIDFILTSKLEVLT